MEKNLVELCKDGDLNEVKSRVKRPSDATYDAVKNAHDNGHMRVVIFLVQTNPAILDKFDSSPLEIEQD
jgi:hypothetical protein